MSKAVAMPERAWKYPSRWEVRLSGTDGSFAKRPATSYDDAVKQRKDALGSGRYYQGWIEEKR
jgi:hypothetical protein